jgi:L-ornithine N5-oxygenase
MSTRPDVDPSDIPLDPDITIRPHSSLIGADILPPKGTPTAGVTYNDSNSELDTVLITVQHTLTRAINHSSYDALICGTGYDRTSWQKLFTNSELGKYFVHGTSGSGPIQFVPSHSDEVVELEDPSDMLEQASPTSSTSASSISSPPTSPGSWWPLARGVGEKPARMYVSRAYRLLPVPGEVTELPRIYVQGCTEMTHGLSDTLLSVVGIKSGEVVDDLLKA